MTLRPLPLRDLRAFTCNDETRYLTDPDAAPTGRQLLALWHAGALAVVHPDAEHHVFTRAQAAWAIAWLRGDE